MMMVHKCIHMKFGTVLYCRGGDVLVALSWAPEPPEPEIQCQNPDMDNTLKETSIIVNMKKLIPITTIC